MRNAEWSAALTRCMARERPCLPLRREVARRIKNKNAVTEGEIHRVCVKAAGIDGHKTKIISV